MRLDSVFSMNFNPHQKKLTIPPPPRQTAAKLCAVDLFFGRDNELQIRHANLLLIDNKRKKLFVIEQSDCANYA